MKMGIALLSALLILFSCGNSINKEKIDPESGVDFSFGTLAEIPSEIDGCSCVFSETKNQYTEAEYIFASNLDSLGFIQINNQLVRLKLISSGSEPYSFRDHDHVEFYQSDEYKVTVKIKYNESSGSESWFIVGSIIIENNSGQMISKKIYGECGC